ncbi:MAG: hypothetical protein HQK68_05735 [Desulfamplus sp.]|nr:hypothetical protein [Desulfamplus sp.]
MSSDYSIKYLGSLINLSTVSLAVVAILFVTGCSNNLFSGSSKKSATSKTSQQSNGVYYDFEDVLVPRDMKIDDSSTFVVSTPGQTSGIITVKGRISKESLLKFFNNNMQKDGWNIISQIRSPAATILIFQKSSRWSVITLREKEYYTYAEIGVAPSFGGGDTSSNSFNTPPSNSGFSSSDSDSGFNSKSGGKIESENLFE